MSDHPSPDWQLLDRYLAGQASAQEEAAVLAWTRDDPVHAELLRQLREAGPDARRAWNADAGWASLSSRLELDGSVRPIGGAGQATRPARWRPSAAWRVAAAVIVVVAGSLTAWQIVARRAQSGALASATMELNAPNGQRASITLDDGSRVTLNAGSRLRYPKTTGTGAREVMLVGEAFFEVKHDAAHPFRVHAGDGIAEDLGTRFTVSAYPELERVDVAVAEGRVSLQRKDAASGVAVLHAGERGRLGITGPPVVDSQVPLDQYFGWRDGALVFENVALGDAIPRLERWYDVEIKVSDSALAARRLTARFRNDSLTDVIGAIEVALGATSHRSGRTITLSPGSR